MYEPKIGDSVGAHRWPYWAAHPDCWGKPWGGVVIALDDPRAWANTLAFPTPDPDPEKVKAHVQWCKSQDLLKDKCAVLWDFEGKAVPTFESYGRNSDYDVRPYANDFRKWKQERAAMYARDSKLVAA